MSHNCSCSMYKKMCFSLVKKARAFDINKFVIFESNLHFARAIIAQIARYYETKDHTYMGIIFNSQKAIDNLTENRKMINIAKKEMLKVNNQKWFTAFKIMLLIVNLSIAVVAVLVEWLFNISLGVRVATLAVSMGLSQVIPWMIEICGNLDGYTSKEKPLLEKILKSSGEIDSYIASLRTFQRIGKIFPHENTDNTITEETLLENDDFKIKDVADAITDIKCFSTKTVSSDDCAKKHNDMLEDAIRKEAQKKELEVAKQKKEAEQKELEAAKRREEERKVAKQKKEDKQKEREDKKHTKKEHRKIIKDYDNIENLTDRLVIIQDQISREKILCKETPNS